MTQIPTIEATQYGSPANWAVQQRRLIDMMNQVGIAFVDRYT